LSAQLEAFQLKIRLHLLFQLAHLTISSQTDIRRQMPTVKGDCKKSAIIQQRGKWLANNCNTG
jgi:hypothetical protein